MQIINTVFEYFNLGINGNALNLDQDLEQEISNLLLGVNFTTPETRIQTELSDYIVTAFLNHFPNTFTGDNQDIRCSLNLPFKYDGRLTIGEVNIGLEVQFRPDFLKDLSRFRIGYDAGRIQAMLYIVAFDRNTINANYKSMPQFSTIVDHLNRMPWFNVPVVVIGINGDNEP